MTDHEGDTNADTKEADVPYPDDATQTEVAQRRTKAVNLRVAGYTWQAIADEMGYPSRQAAHNDVKRALETAQKELALTVEEYRELEDEKLSAAERAVQAVLDRKHVTVSHGKVIVDERTGEPLLDDAPVLQAVDRLLRIQQRRAALRGLDTAVKQAVDLGGTVNYVINGVDPSKLT